MKVDPESLCFLGLFALMGVSQVYLINIHVNLVLTSAFVIVIGCYQSLQLKIDVSQGKNVEVSPLAGGVPGQPRRRRDGGRRHAGLFDDGHDIYWAMMPLECDL